MTCNDDDTCNYANAQVVLKINLETILTPPQVTGIYNNWNPNEDELKELVYMNPTATAIMVRMVMCVLY